MRRKDNKDYIYEFLSLFFDEMEVEGVTHEIISMDIDDDFKNRLNDKVRNQLVLDEVKKIADRCFAGEWIKQTAMCGKYNHIGLTISGLGYVKSKRMQLEVLRDRSFFKKLSDFVEAHSGIFVLLSFAVSLFSFVISVVAIYKSIK